MVEWAKFRRRCGVAGPIAGLLTIGCGADIQEDTAERSEPVFGGNTRDVTGSTANPYAAVGQLSFAAPYGGTCSGVLIERNLVLTARHCLCIKDSESNLVSFSLPTLAAPIVAVDHF